MLKAKRLAAIAALVLVSSATDMTVAAAAAPAPVHELAVYYDANNNRSPYRQGVWNGKTGFGYVKISTYHNVHNLGSVEFAVHNPAGGKAVTGGPGSNDLEYYAWANKGYRDSAGTIHYTDSVELLVVSRLDYHHAYYGVVMDGTPGIITSYCFEYQGPCPGWVDKAFSNGGVVLNAQPGDTPTTASGEQAVPSGGTVVYSGSYQPASAFHSSNSSGSDVDQNSPLNGDSATE